MREKAGSIRTYDDEGYKKRAACVCVKGEPSSLQVLMVNSNKRPDKWIFPGGGIEPGEEPRLAAMRETAEEAGVMGVLEKYLGVFEGPNTNRKHRTEVFLMEVKLELPHWDESVSQGRQRKWFTIDEALKNLRESKVHQIAYLESMISKLGSTTLK